jgi:dipicolinate synthase subunit A
MAVVGGDEREREICRLAAGTGAEVRAFGFPWPAAGIDGVTHAADAAAALRGAHVALFPIPGMGTDGTLFGSERIVPDEGLLRELAPGAHIILGRANERLVQAADATGITLHEYESDPELTLLRAPAIVEAVVKTTVEHADITIHGARIGVVGYGNIGRTLVRTLVLLQARVHLFARNGAQRADARATGATAHPIDELAALAPDLDMLFSTVPAPIVDARILDRLPVHAFVADISAPPGSIDLDHARAVGLRAVWARALGRHAPVTVGRSQWLGISSRIEDILASRGGNTRNRKEPRNP